VRREKPRSEVSGFERDAVPVFRMLALPHIFFQLVVFLLDLSGPLFDSGFEVAVDAAQVLFRLAAFFGLAENGEIGQREREDSGKSGEIKHPVGIDQFLIKFAFPLDQKLCFLGFHLPDQQTDPFRHFRSRTVFQIVRNVFKTAVFALFDAPGEKIHSLPDRRFELFEPLHLGGIIGNESFQFRDILIHSLFRQPVRLQNLFVARDDKAARARFGVEQRDQCFIEL
jgi:hypothetical protein